MDGFLISPKTSSRIGYFRQSHVVMWSADQEQKDLDTQELQAKLDKLSWTTTQQEQEDLETQKLQSELDKLTQEPPMFASFDGDLVDNEALPVPAFTALIVSIGSLIWTYYLFDLGINGFAPPPN